MNILLIAATAREIQPFFDYYRRSKKLDVDVLITGVGLTATCYHLAKQLSLKKPSFVIQAGFGGCFDSTVSPGETVIVKKDRVADEAVLENGEFKTVFDLGLREKNQFPYKNGWLPNNNRLIQQIELEKVTSITVNTISTSAETINFYREKFKPATESMEGAALHYVCLMEKIPFIQLRGITNYIGERNKSKWKIKEATTNLNKELIRTIEKLRTIKPKL